MVKNKNNRIGVNLDSSINKRRIEWSNEKNEVLKVETNAREISYVPFMA